MGNRILTWLVILIFLTLLLGESSAYAQQDAPDGTLTSQQQSLLQRAQAEGRIWVIVRLNTPYALPQANAQAFQTNLTHYQGLRSQLYDTLQTGFNAQRTPIKFRVHANAQNWYVPYTALLVDASALRVLLSSPLVADVQESELSAPTLESSLPIIGADFAHADGFTGAGQIIAILDTGVEAEHPFLQDGDGLSRVIDEACFSTNQGAPIRSLCPSRTPAEFGPGSASPTVFRCIQNTQNLCQHGTHVAGIAAGRGGSINAMSFDGVAPDAGIVAVQVFSRVTGTACGSDASASPCVLSYRHNQIDGLNHVLNLAMANIPLAAVNMSLGNSANNTTACDQDARKDMIDALLVWDVATVISAGNSGHPTGVGAPACISTAVTVSAVRDNLNVPGFANTGDLVDLFAPGVNVWSSVPDASYASLNGTSMAAPHVTGAWAVMKAVQPLGVDEIQTHLHDTGSPVGGVTVTARSINLYEAIQTLAPPSPITAFFLINADTDKIVRQLVDGDRVNLFDIGTNNINVVAVTDAQQVSSVVFGLKDDTQDNPRFRVETGTPYALAGDKNNNYFAWKPVVGKQYTVTATPYIQETPGASGSITFDVIEQSDQSVEGLTLINADTDQPLDVLEDGQVIDLADYPTRNLNIRADTNPGNIGSVVFALPENPRYRVENGAPYTIGGDNAGDVFPWRYELKAYQLTVTTYTKRGGRGVPGASYNLTFSITDSTALTTNQDGLRQIAPP